jgi:hypothetical protein
MPSSVTTGSANVVLGREKDFGMVVAAAKALQRLAA